MRKRLYYKDPYIREFTANITRVNEKDNKFNVELDQTAFYPEGGGQPCDLGEIDGIPVTYVYEEDNTVFHVLDRKSSRLDDVNCKIDWERRFDHMQQHLGQHILSAVFVNLCDAETVSFHLGNESLYIDINKTVGYNGMKKAETMANQVVFNNIKVEVLYPTAEELKKLSLRKLPPAHEDVRIVKVQDIDVTPCCGTHPNTTGEVGLIKIRKWEKHKQGTRVELVCGSRALKDYFEKNEAINKISSLLSIKDSEAAQGVERIKDELAVLKKENKDLKEQMVEYEAENLLNSFEDAGKGKIIKSIFENRNFKEVQFLASKLASQPGVIVLFGLKNEDKVQMIFTRAKDLEGINMVNILKKYIPLIDGRGGGNEYTAQGGGSNAAKLDEALEFAYGEVREILK